MKAVGIILIIAGILMFVFGSISFTQEKKVADLGPVEINKKEKKNINWPPYAGGIAAVAGIILLAAGRNRKA